MEYNDEIILSNEDYKTLANAYAQELKARNFMLIKIDDQENHELVQQTFDNLYHIKTLLFSLGGFLNTSQFYSLNERQIKKLSIIFDYEYTPCPIRYTNDRTKNFLSFLSHEMQVIKNLIELAEKSSFEDEIKKITHSRLTLLSNILKV